MLKESSVKGSVNGSQFIEENNDFYYCNENDLKAMKMSTYSFQIVHHNNNHHEKSSEGG